MFTLEDCTLLSISERLELVHRGSMQLSSDVAVAVSGWPLCESAKTWPQKKAHKKDTPL